MKKKLINIVGSILLILSFGFIINRLVKMDIDLASVFTPTITAMVVVFPFLGVLIIFCNSFCWNKMLSLLTEHSIPLGETVKVYSKSNIMKYLPGNVGHYAGRQLLGSKFGIKQAQLAMASILELAYATFSLLMIAMVFSAKTIIEKLKELLSDKLVVLFAVVVSVFLATVVLASVLFRKSKYAVSFGKIFKNPQFWIRLLFCIVLTGFASFILVAEYLIILGQFTTFSFHVAFQIIASNYAAIFIGMITPGVPGGIGVREAVLVALLSKHFPGDMILLTSVVHRIMMILGDVMAVPVSFLFYEKQEKYLDCYKF